jgi:hypothetical protein
VVRRRPGVPETGPLNPHFVRDIGCAYFLTSFALAGLAFTERGWPAALIGALFLTLHALARVATVSPGGYTRTMSSPTSSPCMRRPQSLPGLSFSPPPSQEICPCLVDKAAHPAFERVYGCDTSYLRDMLAADVKAVKALWKVQDLSQIVPGTGWPRGRLSSPLGSRLAQKNHSLDPLCIGRVEDCWCSLATIRGKTEGRGFALRRGPLGW